jgi:hypothetical protein
VAGAREVGDESPVLSRGLGQGVGSQDIYFFLALDNLAHGFGGQGMGRDSPGIPGYQRRP